MPTQFDSFFKQHAPSLFSFALKLTNNKMDADDLVQETAIKAFKNFHKFNKDSSFKNWSFTILKNTFITKYRKRKQKKVVSTSIEELEYAIAPTYMMIDESSDQTIMKYLKNCINQLRPKSKEPFEMYVSGYQYDEIASGLDIPLGTVKSRINYARKKLKNMIVDRKLLEAA